MAVLRLLIFPSKTVARFKLEGKDFLWLVLSLDWITVFDERPFSGLKFAINSSRM